MPVMIGFHTTFALPFVAGQNLNDVTENLRRGEFSCNQKISRHYKCCDSGKMYIKDTKKKILRFKEMDYVIRYPKGFSENKKYPALFYIHGAGGRGRNIDIVYNHVFYNKTDKYNFNAISIAPQCYEHSWFSIFEQLQEFVEFIINQKFFKLQSCTCF